MGGYIVPEYFKWPGYLSPTAGIKFADVPNGLGALSKVPASGWAQIFIFCGALDTGFFVYDESREPGDYANGGVMGVPNASTSCAFGVHGRLCCMACFQWALRGRTIAARWAMPGMHARVRASGGYYLKDA